jgi:hypothetical protein
LVVTDVDEWAGESEIIEPMSNRHDFSKNTIDILGKRVRFMCANPNCKKTTIGPHSENTKATLVGIAAHITAASPGGPRYDSNLTEDQRRSIENGIWLCANCALIIDKDEKKYTKELLEEWKTISENYVLKDLQGQNITKNKNDRPYLEVDLVWMNGGRGPDGYADENFKAGEQRIIRAGQDYIMYYNLNWRYRVAIINNSSLPAYNVSIRRTEGYSRLKIDPIAKINNIPPYQTLETKLYLEQYYKGYHYDADKLISMDIPPILQDVKLEVSYQDEERNLYSTIIDFSSGEIIQTFINNENNE